MGERAWHRLGEVTSMGGEGVLFWFYIISERQAPQRTVYAHMYLF